MRNPGDTDVFIPAAGFQLGATATRRRPAGKRAPAVVLVSGPAQDRDENRYGVPIFAQLWASWLTPAISSSATSAASVRVVGAPRTRPSTPTLEDVVNVVTWPRRQRKSTAIARRRRPRRGRRARCRGGPRETREASRLSQPRDESA
jgi:hypothetical protein